MHYADGQAVALDDVVRFDIGPGLSVEGRVVLIGDAAGHRCSDARFIEWVIEGALVDDRSIVVEWTGANPFAHELPDRAPVGNHMIVQMCEDVVLVNRAGWHRA